MFEFTTDNESKAFCMEIAQQMAKRYSISIEHAIERINYLWHGQTFVGEEDDHYHWSVENWTKHIFNYWDTYHSKNA